MHGTPWYYSWQLIIVHPLKFVSIFWTFKMDVMLLKSYLACWLFSKETKLECRLHIKLWSIRPLGLCSTMRKGNSSGFLAKKVYCYNLLVAEPHSRINRKAQNSGWSEVTDQWNICLVWANTDLRNLAWMAYACNVIISKEMLDEPYTCSNKRVALGSLTRSIFIKRSSSLLTSSSIFQE